MFKNPKLFSILNKRNQATHICTVSKYRPLWAFKTFPKHTVVNNSFKNVFILHEVSQAEMTKTKTQAELQSSRELQRAWLVHSASELRNRLLTPTPRDAHHHSEATQPNKHTLSKQPHEQCFVLPYNVEESWGEKKKKTLIA